MKKMFTLCIGILISMAAFAQYSPNATTFSDHELLRIRGSKIYAGPRYLHQEEAAGYFTDIYGVDRSEDYIRYRRAYNAGLGLTVTGSVIAGAGFGITAAGGIVILFTAPLAALAGEFPEELKTMPKIGACTMLAGAAFLAAGIPTLCVYKKRMRGLVADYNSQATGRSGSGVELSFGGQSSGVGLALKF